VRFVLNTHHHGDHVGGNENFGKAGAVLVAHDRVRARLVDRMAHTDGDAIVHFRNADVVHLGDCFFNGIYPFIDLDSGGSLDGVIAALDRVLPALRTATCWWRRATA
jgi:glyoxylase-like metal-dependent hydrolase (beta-lactamase superfamily II)